MSGASAAGRANYRRSERRLLTRRYRVEVMADAALVNLNGRVCLLDTALYTYSDYANNLNITKKL